MLESCVSRAASRALAGARFVRAGFLVSLGLCALGLPVGAQFGTVEATAKISSTEGGFMSLVDNDQWGISVADCSDLWNGWIPAALQALPRIAQRGRIDAIVSTSPPAACHLIARRAKATFRGVVA